MRRTTSIGSALCVLLVFIACGSDNSTNNDREPVADDSANNDEPAADNGASDDQTPASGGAVDITSALFTNLDASCASYANAYFSSVKDVQNGLSFDGDLTILLLPYRHRARATRFP
jgi:hypothetical protein